MYQSLEHIKFIQPRGPIGPRIYKFDMPEVILQVLFQKVSAGWTLSVSKYLKHNDFCFLTLYVKYNVEK